MQSNPPFFIVFVIGFAVAILAGTLLLWHPLSSRGETTYFVDALFTSASAFSDTGLSVVPPDTHWGFFGQLVILVLIQLGGLAFMLISSYLLIVLGEKVHLLDFRFSDAVDTSSRPECLKFAGQTLLLAVLIEGLGVLLLYPSFLAVGSGEDALWNAVFHAVSAFNNAGFSLVAGGTMSPFYNDAPALLTLILLMFLGGISAPVLINLATRLRWRALSLNSKLAISVSLGLLAFGTLGILVSEWGNPATLGYMTLTQKLVHALFVSANSRSAGFAALDFQDFGFYSLVLVMGLMFIGGVAGSTAGGIKVNTFAVLALTVRSQIMGRSRVHAFGRLISERRVHEAVTVFTLTIVVLFSLILALTLTEDAPRMDLAFETFSALGTVGLSTGITSSLSTAGRLIIALTMFVGRNGPLTLVLAVSERRQAIEDVAPEEAIKVA